MLTSLPVPAQVWLLIDYYSVHVRHGSQERMSRNLCKMHLK